MISLLVKHNAGCSVLHCSTRGLLGFTDMAGRPPFGICEAVDASIRSRIAAFGPRDLPVNPRVDASSYRDPAGSGAWQLESMVNLHPNILGTVGNASPWLTLIKRDVFAYILDSNHQVAHISMSSGISPCPLVGS